MEVGLLVLELLNFDTYNTQFKIINIFIFKATRTSSLGAKQIFTSPETRGLTWKL